MSDQFKITSDLEKNERFLSVGLLAREIYRCMITHCDAEGRARSSGLTWKREAALFGPAETSIEDIDDAIDELFQVELIQLYAGGKYLFLPGRFEHNAARRHWKASTYPLPEADFLEKWPEYRAGLIRLTTKGRLADSLSPGECWRYPELRSAATDEPGAESAAPDDDRKVLQGAANGCKAPHNSESRYGVGVGVGVGEEGEGDAAGDNLGITIRDAVSPRVSKKQIELIRTMAIERGLDPDEMERRICPPGAAPLTSAGITALISHLKSIRPPPAKRKRTDPVFDSEGFIIGERVV